MRRHMQSVWHCGRCLGVSTRCLETQFCVLWIVVGMNEIVQRAWVVWMTGIHAFKELYCPPLLLKSVRAFHDSTEDGQSIEQRGFVIRELRVDGRHRFAVILVAGRFGSRTGVLVQSGH